jgi:hypothetical protein
MPGEDSTRAGGLKARLTSLPRRQADAGPVSAVARMGTWPGIAAAGTGRIAAAHGEVAETRGRDGNGCDRTSAGHA